MSAELTPLEEVREIRAAIAALQAQAESLSSTVLELALAPLRQRLARLEGAADSPWLRQVCVLFVDVVDSTRLVRALDEEESHRVLDGALRRFAEVIAEHNGTVLRFTGDGLKAAFGVPEPSEDDAERAVAAGLRILEAARLHARELARSIGVGDFAVRLGVHTGPVAMGSGVEESQTLVGATVHLAARLEQSAEPGTLRISRDTHRLLRGAVEAEAQAPLVVKGLDLPLESYVVTRLLSSSERALARGATPTEMVGRERELGLLRGTLEDVEADRRLRSATVLAEAGLGKSRLCGTFVQEQQRRGTRTLIATAWPRTEQHAFGLLRELVLRFLESGHGTPPLEPAAALESQTMRALLIDPNEQDAKDSDPMALAHLLGYAIGLGFEESPHVRGLRAERGLLRQRVFHAATLWLRNLTGSAPLLLLIDDLHWADDATLDLLLLWRETLTDLPLCLVALARPSLLERRPRWTTTDSTARTIELGPLAEEESRELAARVLAGDSRVPEEARASLLARAQGNPYYLEELLAMLVDEPGAVDAGRERSGSGTSLLSRLPVTLTAALQARLSRLDGDTRRALQQASVVGPHFSEAALRAVDANAPRFLAALEAQGLVHAEGSGAWRFHHQLLQEVAYDSLLRRERAAWHARVAAHAAERGDSSPTSIAEHYDRAGNAHAAVQHYLRALEDTGRMGLKEQLKLGERALQLAPELEESARLRLHRICLRCYLEMRQPDRATVHADAARAIADLREDDALRADLAFELALFEEPAPDPVSADAVVDLAKRAASRGQASPLAAAYALSAWALCTHGRAEEAYSIAREALAVAEAAGEPPPSQALTSAAIAAWKLGDLSAGLAYVRTGLDVDRLRGNRAGELSGHCNLAGMARTLGDRQAWSQALEDGFRLARQLGNRVSEPLLRVRRAQLALLDGRIDAALADTQHALDLLPPQDRWFRITALLARGHALLAARDGAAAEQSFAEARLGAGEDAGMQAEALEGLVRTALARGDTSLAVDRARELRAAIDAPEPGDITERPAQLLAIFDALSAAGDPDAATVLAEARAEVTAQAARISDPDSRERFLHAVAHNARIVGQPLPGAPRLE